MNSTGLLFYLPGDSTTAAIARGEAKPNFERDVSIQTDEKVGSYIQCEDTQLLAFRAPHNMYAERGSLSFFWRSRYPVGPTAFPIFRVGMADHTSWDSVFLRVDYNGEGIDALITDANLSRARIHYCPEHFPDEKTWMHICVTWDENFGLCLYIDGQKVGEEYRPAVYFSGLDQFGPHSRIIANWQVQSAYNYVRGGDICKIAVYDRMLTDEAVATLAEGRLVEDLPPYAPEFSDEAVKAAFLQRTGLNGAVEPLSGPTIARKVEIHTAYDLKRWWWKACDGIAETTWPGVYNRSRLKGRNDYFQLPDWDCYSLSGRAITFTAEEPFNHIEIAGSAHGPVERVDAEKMGNATDLLFARPAGVQRTIHRLPMQSEGYIRLSNEEAEEPISDFSLFRVTAGDAPTGKKTMSYSFAPGYAADCPVCKELADFITGRYTSYERHIMTAILDNAGDSFALTVPAEDQEKGYPFVNIIVPYEADDTLGLDGVRITLPARNADALYAVQVKDPLWYYRNLAHFTFAVKAGEEAVLYLDTRDRILPKDRALYMTIACDDMNFTTADLQKASLQLVYKDAAEAKAEHVLDRFTQVKDVYGHLVEEQPGTFRLNMFLRFYRDIHDLLKIDPHHKQGQYYYFDKIAGPTARLLPDVPKDTNFKPEYETAAVPSGIPAWAFKQVEYLKHYKYVINWLIDNRQIDNGEFGGGLSDDGDFVCTWAYLAAMGADPDKILKAMLSNTEAFYNQGMFTNGLCSIQADELHSSEEGLISLNGCLTADLGNPIMLERAMETARGLFWVSGINSVGHRHIRSAYFSGSRMATEAPWNEQKGSSFAAFCPVWQVSRYNGNEKVRRLMLEFAESMKAHYHDGVVHMHIRFDDDCEMGEGAPTRVKKNDPTVLRNPHQNTQLSVLKAAYYQTGNQDYMDMLHIPSEDPVITDLASYHEEVAKKYDQMSYIAGMREYYNTEGHPWIDRVFITCNGLLCDRLANPYGVESRAMYPSHRIGWRFDHLGDDEKLGILTPVAKENEVKIVVYNLSDEVVTGQILGNEILPGTWTVSYGIDGDLDDNAESITCNYTSPWERGTGVPVEFAPKAQTIVTLKLVAKSLPYSDRCDLGICRADLHYYDHGLNVRVHSLGNVDSPETEIVLKNAEGKILKREMVPPMEAPRDLWPRYWDVIFNLYGIDSLEGCYLEIDPENKLCEITRHNNIVKLSSDSKGK